MTPRAREQGGWSRSTRLVGLATALGLGGAVSMVLPPLVGMSRSALRLLIPYPIRWVLTEWGLFWLLLAAGVLLTRRPTRILSLAIPPDRWTHLDDRSSWLLQGPLSAVLMVLCLLMLAGWIPHYLTWPWWVDIDMFAVTAQSWDNGILPYRDLYDFNFPGPMYLSWALGKVFGWGKTAPVYAIDASLVVLLGAAMLSWSQRRFGRSLPGLAGYLVFLRYYLSLEYYWVAERDWQAPLFAVLGLFTLQVRPGRAGRVLSALAFAAALVFRPHVVLFLPALVSAIDENARRPGDSWRLTIRALAEWVSLLTFGLLLGFAPVLLAGVGDEFVETFRLAWYGGDYNRVSRTSITSHLVDELLRWETSAVLAAIALLTVSIGSVPRRTAQTWALALLFVLFYKPLSPVAFGYHDHPLMLVWSISISLVVEWILGARWLVPPVQVLAVTVVLLESVPGLPVYCSIIRSAQAIPPLLRGVEPIEAPLGSERDLRNDGYPYSYLSWQDYCAVLNHLRKTTDSQTRVANFLRRRMPLPAVNGPVGRLTAFPCAEGIQWLRWVAPNLEGQFAQALAQPRDTVVVWIPNETGHERLEQTIRQFYRPEARFGAIEVWRRRRESSEVTRRRRTGGHLGMILKHRMMSE